MDGQHQPPRQHRQTRTLVALLCVMCAALGITWSWGRAEREGRLRLLSEVRATRQTSQLEVARQGEMRRFLADVETELVRLRGTQRWSGQTLTLAWNPRLRQGVLVTPLPASDRSPYHLWADGGGDGAAHAVALTAESWQRPFPIPVGLALPVQFRVSAGGAEASEAAAGSDAASSPVPPAGGEAMFVQSGSSG